MVLEAGRLGLYILGKAAFSNLINSGKRTLYNYILLYFIYIYKKVPLWANRHMGVLNNAGDYAREYMVYHCGYAPMTNFSPRDFSIVFLECCSKAKTLWWMRVKKNYFQQAENH